MRLGTLTASASVSAILLSGCSFIGGQSSDRNNPYANQQSASHSQYGGQYGRGAYNQQDQYGQASGNRCQIFSPSQPIPRGCRPEQVTLGVAPQAAQNGFPQEPQFGQQNYTQPEYTSGAYGTAVGQTAALAHHTGAANKRKPRLRGSLSFGFEKSASGDLLDFDVRDDLDPESSYDPQAFNASTVSGTQADGSVTTTTYTANSLQAETDEIFTNGVFDSSSAENVSFNDAWKTQTSIKGGLEYIVNPKTTVFVNGGYTYAGGETVNAVNVNGTLYREVSTQPFGAGIDTDGDGILDNFPTLGAPESNVTFITEQQEIATFAYDFSDLERYDLEVGARHYFDPIVKSEGYRTVTPFVGASVGVSRVNAVDFSTAHSQLSYSLPFNGTAIADSRFDVPQADNSTRLYDAQWLPQGQLNVGAEWQVTPRMALALESGVRIQGARDYADFINAANETVEGANGDTDISVPLTLRGSFNF